MCNFERAVWADFALERIDLSEPVITKYAFACAVSFATCSHFARGAILTKFAFAFACAVLVSAIVTQNRVGIQTVVIRQPITLVSNWTRFANAILIITCVLRHVLTEFANCVVEAFPVGRGGFVNRLPLGAGCANCVRCTLTI
jgi:hypothetical protein